MSKKVTSIHGNTIALEGVQADPDVISSLEEYLQDAKDGKIRAICVVAITSNNEVILSQSGEGDRYILIGALQQLSLKFSLDMLDGTCDEL